MKKIGLLLGSFDPPHIGHVWAANYALNTGLDVVWIVPAWENPWKANQTPFEQRIEMCERTFDNAEGTIKTMYIDGTYKSHYTYECLDKLLNSTKQFNHTYTIIGGTDVVNQIKEWKNGDWILEHFNVLEVPRSGYTETPLGIECSSTSLRKMLQEGKSVVPFIDTNTLIFIKDNKLYDSKHS